MGRPSTGGLPDVVYVVKKAGVNAELRYSLRSLRNLPHRSVWIVGHKPAWAVAEHLPTRNGLPTKYENSTANLLVACTHPDISDEFVLMNDDFFVLQPLESLPVFHFGPVDDVYRDLVGRHGPQRPYLRGMAETARLLEGWGYPNPLSYELHIPMTISKQGMVGALRRASEEAQITALHKRTLYGNVQEVGGTEMADVKVYGRTETWGDDQIFVSTLDSSFSSGKVGVRLRELFPDPSPYERE